MAEPRAVRIARAKRPESETVPRPGSGRGFPNRGGTLRAQRVFGLYSILLVAIYATFLGIALASPEPGLRENPVAVGLLTVTGVVLALWGYRITLGRTPRALRLEGPDLVIVERGGRRRNFGVAGSVRVRVADRFSAGWLGPEPTELVEIALPEGGQRVYLVARDLVRSATGVP